jgi:hypothetical protein
MRKPRRNVESDRGRRLAADTGLTMPSRMGALLAALVLIGLCLPSTSLGAVTIGSNLADTPNISFACSATHQCTVIHASLQSSLQAPGGITSPMDGVVVRWRVRSASSPGTLTLRIVKPNGSGQFTGDGTGAPVTPVTDGSVNTFATRLPIHAGEQIGVDCCNAVSDFLFHSTGNASDAFSYFGGGGGDQPDLVDGEPFRSPQGTNANIELLVNADIEADADHDGYGDETQDLCPTDPTTQGPCPSTGTTGAQPLAGPTGERAAALKKCKKKHGAARARCKKRANLLPV